MTQKPPTSSFASPNGPSVIIVRDTGLALVGRAAVRAASCPRDHALDPHVEVVDRSLDPFRREVPIPLPTRDDEVLGVHDRIVTRSASQVDARDVIADLRKMANPAHAIRRPAALAQRKDAHAGGERGIDARPGVLDDEAARGLDASCVATCSSRPGSGFQLPTS
jgi:hypothetical protein